MERAAVRWHGPYRLDRIDRYDLDYTMGIYAVLDSEYHPNREKPWGIHKLLYVGHVYDQTFSERLRQHLTGDDVWHWVVKHLKKRPTAKIGHIELIDQGRVTKELIRDVESLLIIILQPPANVQSRDTYYGRDLRVFNRGKYSPLPEELSTDDFGE